PRQRSLKRQRLGLGLRHDRRAATHMAIYFGSHRSAAAGNQLCNHPAQRLRQTDDGRVAEQIEQERLDGRRIVRPSEIKEDNSRLHGVRARICSTSWLTWSGGVSGTRPWPRLKI